LDNLNFLWRGRFLHVFLLLALPLPNYRDPFNIEGRFFLSLLVDQVPPPMPSGKINLRAFFFIVLKPSRCFLPLPPSFPVFLPCRTTGPRSAGLSPQDSFICLWCVDIGSPSPFPQSNASSVLPHNNFYRIPQILRYNRSFLLFCFSHLLHLPL